MLRRVEAREEMALLSEDTEEGPEEGPPGWPWPWQADWAVTSALRLISRSRLQ